MNRKLNASQASVKTSAVNLKASNAKVKKEVPTAWKDRVSHEDYEQLRDVFLLFDEDGSGIIDPQEIVKVLEDIGLDKRNPNVVKIIWALR
jgi:Ca2+-binding EF-hand superfamily protein